MKKEFERMRIDMIMNAYYVQGDINKFLKEIEDIKLVVESTNCNDKKWINYSGRRFMQLELLAKIFETKKLQRNHDDVREIGKFLQNLGKEIEEFDYSKIEMDDSRIENSQEETVETFFSKIIEKLLEDEE